MGRKGRKCREVIGGWRRLSFALVNFFSWTFKQHKTTPWIVSCWDTSALVFIITLNVTECVITKLYAVIEKQLTIRNIHHTTCQTDLRASGVRLSNILIYVGWLKIKVIYTWLVGIWLRGLTANMESPAVVRACMELVSNVLFRHSPKEHDFVGSPSFVHLSFWLSVFLNFWLIELYGTVRVV
jgi:glucan phosphoethanolaminetransferase (alkaline phosphatase superfamily)